MVWDSLLLEDINHFSKEEGDGTQFMDIPDIFPPSREEVRSLKSVLEYHFEEYRRRVDDGSMECYILKVRNVLLKNRNLLYYTGNLAFDVRRDYGNFDKTVKEIPITPEETINKLLENNRLF